MLIKGLNLLIILVWLEADADYLSGPFRDDFHYFKSTYQTNLDINLEIAHTVSYLCTDYECVVWQGYLQVLWSKDLEGKLPFP